MLTTLLSNKFMLLATNLENSKLQEYPRKSLSLGKLFLRRI